MVCNVKTLGIDLKAGKADVCTRLIFSLVVWICYSYRSCPDALLKIVKCVYCAVNSASVQQYHMTLCLVRIRKEGPIISRNPSTFRDSHALANGIF